MPNPKINLKKLLKISLTLVITAILVTGIIMPEIIMGTPVSTAVGNWYQQFMPNLNGRTISDIFFIDSLTGWAVTPYRFQNDSSYVLKTTSGGDAWYIQHIRIGQFVGSSKVKFLNANTGYTARASDLPSYSAILKTTDGGNTWFNVNPPTDPFFVNDIHILSNDTIWVVNDESFAGGVFFTSNGGVSWVQQFSGGNQNPNKIYMYNARIGFICNNTASSPRIYKTTDGGGNWLINLIGEYFYDIHFTDSLTGWKCMPGFIAGDSCVKRTTNGGANWVKQILPSGGIIINSQIIKFSFVNKDTIWGAGGYVNSGGLRGILYRTTDAGINWLFQIPDTSYGIPVYSYIQFVNKNNGWAYYNEKGIRTTSGGDPVWLTSIEQTSTEIPKEFKLYQNYPNPFNPNTKIKFHLLKQGNAEIIIYDITGRTIQKLLNERLSAGEYEMDFNASGLSSGTYFYKLIINSGKEVHTETKKMVLIK